jgi:hypothetical protein
MHDKRLKLLLLCTCKQNHLTVIAIGDGDSHSKVDVSELCICNVDSRTSNARFFACWNSSKVKIIRINQNISPSITAIEQKNRSNVNS